MADSGIVCRYRGNEIHCAECLRVTVGTREQNIKYIEMLREVATKLNGFK